MQANLGHEAMVTGGAIPIRTLIYLRRCAGEDLATRGPCRFIPALKQKHRAVEPGFVLRETGVDDQLGGG